MSYVEDLTRRKPEISSFSQYITNNLADNYLRGLNGEYAKRLNEGIKAATQPVDQISRIIKELIDDRDKVQKQPRTERGKKAKKITHNDINNNLSEAQKRALILGLWSVRIPVINRNQLVDLVNEGVYGDANYIPPINLSTASLTTGDLQKKQDHQPTLTEIGKILEKLSRKGDSND